jgi:Rrf2 family protein
MLQIPRKVDYALRAVIYLSARDPGKSCSAAEIAEHQSIPRKFLEKITQDLIRGGLVRSKRGPDGGYHLARPPREISFRDVIEAVEGPIAVNVCLEAHAKCDHLSKCTMLGVWKEVQERVVEVFARTTLADLPPTPCQRFLNGSSLPSAA